jgi:hypothetical protein
MSFEPWAWESENWGGDPEGQLAKALERARMQTPKPLKLTKLPHKDQTSLKDFEKIESEILSEIEKEGGALGMKNLTKIADETKIKTVLSKMEKDGKLFMHKDGDIYTHEPKGHMNFAESFEADDKFKCSDCGEIDYNCKCYLKDIVCVKCDEWEEDCQCKTPKLRYLFSKDGDGYGEWVNDAESFEAQATHIDWETDGQEVDLPKTVEVPDDLDADEIADYLSDEHGFLVNTFQIKDAESFDAERARYTADWENSPYSSWDDAWSDDVNFPTVEKSEKLWLKNLTTIGVLAGAIYIGRKIKGV